MNKEEMISAKIGIATLREKISEKIRQQVANAKALKNLVKLGVKPDHNVITYLFGYLQGYLDQRLITEKEFEYAKTALTVGEDYLGCGRLFIWWATKQQRDKWEEIHQSHKRKEIEAIQVMKQKSAVKKKKKKK